MQKVSNLNQNKNQDIFVLSDASDNDVYQLKKSVVLFVLRQSLLESGSEAFELVNRSLFEKYRYGISDCFENPGYLVNVLRYVYEGSYSEVIESIKKSLDKFSQESTIKEFLEEFAN